MKVRLESDIVNDKFTEYLYESYDIQDREKTVTEVPIPSKEDIDAIADDEEFNILLVCGRSGSGKSTILRNILNNGLPTIGYDEDKCVISQFPTLSEEEACDLKLLLELLILVLILVIAVDGLGGPGSSSLGGIERQRLNPCYSGRWSRRDE